MAIEIRHDESDPPRGAFRAFEGEEITVAPEGELVRGQVIV